MEIMVFTLEVKGIDNFAEEMLILFQFFVVRIGFQQSIMNGDRYFFVLVRNYVNFVFQHRIFVFLPFLISCGKSIFKILLPLF